MIPEAPLERTDEGLVPVGPGWFVLNARDGRWNERRGRRGLTFTGSDDWDGEYIANEVARRYGASPEEDTQDGEVAYASFPKSKPARYHDGWLPK